VHSLGYYAFELGDFEKAQALFTDALAHAREIRNDEVAAKALDNLGLCATALDRFDDARRSLEESLALYRRHEDSYGTAWVLSHLAWLSERTGDCEQSLKIHAEALALREQLGDRHGIAGTSLAMARCFEALGDRKAAHDARRRSIATYRELHNTIWLAEAFENFGYAEARSGNPRRAAVLLGAAERMRSDAAKRLPAYERAERDDTLVRLERALGAQQVSAEMACGAAMPLDEVVALAMSD
jgi:tetratricopeptide (TPR) repeat protein